MSEESPTSRSVTMTTAESSSPCDDPPPHHHRSQAATTTGDTSDAGASTTTTTSAPSGGLLLVLDLPSGTDLSVDGVTRHLPRDDFLGLVGVPSGVFHLASVRPPRIERGEGSSPEDGRESSQRQRSGRQEHAAATVGLVVLHPDENYGDRWIVARRYDPRTEELSSRDVSSECRGLADAVYSGSTEVPRNRVCRYDEFVRSDPRQANTVGKTNSERNTVDGGEAAEIWKRQVSHVTPSLLRRRGIRSGDKIVPGAFREDDDDDGNDDAKRTPSSDSPSDRASTPHQDGTAVSYPPIPCIEGGDDDVPGSKRAASRHSGTRRFLAGLTPRERTDLLHFSRPPPVGGGGGDAAAVASTAGGAAFAFVVEAYYGGDWTEVVGDLQLSFVLFLHLGCLASFEHWRDLIAMLSLVPPEAVDRHPKLFANVLSVLALQIKSIDVDFFQEVEYSGGNFFVPAMQRLHKSCVQSGEKSVRSAWSGLANVLDARFGMKNLLCEGKQGRPRRTARMDNTDVAGDSSSDEDLSNMEQDEGRSFGDINRRPKREDGDEASHVCLSGSPDADGGYGGEDYEDDPVVVPLEEVEESIARSAALPSPSPQTGKSEHRERYPILFAAITPQEDVLMACARILADASDVSLVREAAAYLEEVEAKAPSHGDMDT